MTLLTNSMRNVAWNLTWHTWADRVTLQLTAVPSAKGLDIRSGGKVQSELDEWCISVVAVRAAVRQNKLSSCSRMS
jgi:hypothetical protein